MKPRTKLQRQVMDYSQHLNNIDKEILEWAKSDCLEHKGYATKSRVICMDCGQRFSPELVWGIERSGFFNGREKWAKGFENQRV